MVAGLDRHPDAGLLPPIQPGPDRQHDPVLRRRLVRSGGNEQPGLADPVGLEFLDDDAIEKRAKVVAHFCVRTLRMRTRARPHAGPASQIGARRSSPAARVVTVAFVALMRHRRRSSAATPAPSRRVDRDRDADRARRSGSRSTSRRRVRGYVITGQEPFLQPYFDARERFRSRRSGSSRWSTTARALAERLLRDGQDYARGYADRVIAAQRRSGQRGDRPRRHRRGQAADGRAARRPRAAAQRRAAARRAQRAGRAQRNARDRFGRSDCRLAALLSRSCVPAPARDAPLGRAALPALESGETTCARRGSARAR